MLRCFYICCTQEELATVVMHPDRNTPVTDFLFHYTTAETLIEGILPEGRFELGSFASLNDPRESKDWNFGLGTRLGWDGVTDEFIDNVQREATGFLKNNTKVGCFSKNDSRVSGYDTDELYLWGCCRPRMWDQYGDEHRGVCLVFNRKRLEECIA